MPDQLDPDTEAIIDAADDSLAAAGLPTYTELAELLNDLGGARSSTRTKELVAEVLVILNREMKLDSR
ncbi:MAG: hypothetical protein I8H71_00810 [Xanthomonadaceae bacterium]|nr:hypothetical protein [Xanthomonadaceae bacterium]